MYYGKLLRQMIAALHQVTDSVASGFNRVDERLQQQTTSIHAAQESQNENYEVRQKWDEERLSENQIAKGDQTRRDERNYSVQNSIRWATWIAAIGAWIYGGIAFVQWYDANRNFAIEERAWVTVHENAPIHLQDGDQSRFLFLLRTPAELQLSEFNWKPLLSFEIPPTDSFLHMSIFRE